LDSLKEKDHVRNVGGNEKIRFYFLIFFVVYLKTLFSSSEYSLQASTGRIRNGELERLWKEAVVA
jgi:hypothetical protein